jgi:hypothetical protein
VTGVQTCALPICPTAMPAEPWRVIDAAGDSFLVDLLSFAADLTLANRDDSIDHLYVVSARGADAIHMMHLSALAYYLTGDEQYRELLYRELIDKDHAVEVAFTSGALVMPRWCKEFFGDHITMAPFWSFLTLLGDCDLRTQMQKVMEVELWQKEIGNLGNAKFDFEYAGTVPDAIATARPAALAEGAALVGDFGGNGGVFEDPRRSYDLPTRFVIDNLPAGNRVICPTEQERTFCEQGVTILGVSFPGKKITHDCTGAPAECRMDGGACADPMAANGLPPHLRRNEGFLWQGNPFRLGGTFGVQGDWQAPGIDLMEAFWLGRTYGAIAAGKGRVLAWQPAGTSCTP